MKLKSKDVKVGDSIYIIHDYDHYIEPVNVQSINHFDKSFVEINDIMLDYNSRIYSTYEECIDALRYIYSIENFDTLTILKYINHVCAAIDNCDNVYVVKRHKNGDKEVRTCNIIEIRYSNTLHKWRLNLRDYKTGHITTHNADSLGLNIFFSKENAMKKLS